MDIPVQIRLFGAFAVRVGAQDVPAGAWRLRKAKSIVKLLALAPERRLHRERMTELLWPDRAPEAAANNFHQALYVARRAFEGAGGDAATVLPLRDDVLALCPDGHLEIDIDAFAAAAGRALQTGEVADHRAALALHTGELLPEDRFEPWASGRREALAEAHLRLLLGLAARLVEAGDTAGGIEALDQAVVVDPLHEEAHRELMRLFAAAGRRQQALAQYHQLRDALRRALAAEPDPQTVQLYRTLLRGDEPEPREPDTSEHTPRPRPPLATGPARDNLPIALTSFVGRDRELVEVARLLDRHRLLTLTGAGGAGKTRLALEAATARRDARSDGVWLVELAGLRDAALVPAAVASILGLTLPSERPSLDGLAALLATWDALLILDNCEHLVGACAVLAERLLAACPSLRLLATSREPLRVPGEVTWRVPSLALPDRDPDGGVAGLRDSESVRLFCERASDARPDFALGEDNAAAIAEICLRLDGMPLALELAAARVGTLSPAQIAERLGDSLAVLTAGSRAALDRQQTLRATLTWSHDLLTDPERMLLRRLAVFEGSFTLEAVEAVAATGELERTEVADLLGRLADKSLVVTEDEAGGYRYRLLESVRQYARERLAEAGEAATLAARHLALYLELVGTAPAPDRLEPEHDNLRAAFDWSLRRAPEQALALAVGMWPMWMAGSHFQEGHRRMEAALAGAPAPTAMRARALRGAAGLEVRLGRMDGLETIADERLAIFRALDDRRAIAHALDESGVYAYMGGHWDRASVLYAESRALAEELGDKEVTATVLFSAGILALCRGEMSAARELLLDSLALLRELAAPDGEAFFRIQTVGLFVALEGPGHAPRMFFEETVQFFRRVDARTAIGYVLAALGDGARADGQMFPARERLDDSLAHFRELGHDMGTAFALNRIGILAGVTGEQDYGAECLEEALALRRELGDQRGIGITLGNLGVLTARGGDLERGRSLIAEARAGFERTSDAPGMAGMRLNLGQLLADAGEAGPARELLEDSRERAREQRLLRCAGWLDLRLAELALAEGDAEQTGERISAALRCLADLGDQWGVARALELEQAAAKRSLSPTRHG